MDIIHYSWQILTFFVRRNAKEELFFFEICIFYLIQKGDTF